MLKLSIITINLNNLSGLKKTMKSVLAQTSKEFEYIVIDGKSTDESPAFIRQMAENDNRITHCLSEEDNGIYHAMNKGIRLAQGEYLQFLNAGDWLMSDDVTEKMLSLDINCGIYYGNKVKVFPDGRELYNKEIPSISMLTFYLGTLNHASAYIKKSLFEKYGYYDESLKIVSDWKFYLIAIGLNNELVEYKDIDVCYFDMNGISNTDSSLDKSERIQVLKEELPFSILSDYDKYAQSVIQMKRINRYKLTRWIVWFIERVLFKLEKFESKRKKEHIIY